MSVPAKTLKRGKLLDFQETTTFETTTLIVEVTVDPNEQDSGKGAVAHALSDAFYGDDIKGFRIFEATDA